MANPMNVLPQLNARPRAGASPDVHPNIKGAGKGAGKSAGLKEEFQSSLDQASAGDQAGLEAQAVAKDQKDLLAKAVDTKKADSALSALIKDKEAQKVLSKASEKKNLDDAVEKISAQSVMNQSVLQQSNRVLPEGNQAVDGQGAGKPETKATPDGKEKSILVPNQLSAKPSLDVQQAAQLASEVTSSSDLSHLDSKAGNGKDGMSLAGPFEVESLKVSDEETLAAQKAQAKPASSRLTTSDFMDLRNKMKPGTDASSVLAQKNAPNLNASLGPIPVGATALKDEKRSKQNGLDGNQTLIAAAQPHTQLHTNSQGMKVIDAPVTQGSGDKLVLTHDSIHQIGQQVNSMSQARQDGEIKIRLRPDHLGDLQMSVKTSGQQVSIEIRARNGESKRIIEESLGALRESLSQQNLTLSRVDVVTQPSHSPQSDASFQMDQGMNRQNFDQSQNSAQFADRSFQGDRNGQDRFFEEEPIRSNLVGRTRGSMSSSSSRLDMIA